MLSPETVVETIRDIFLFISYIQLNTKTPLPADKRIAHIDVRTHFMYKPQIKKNP